MPPILLKVVHVASGDLWAGAEVQLYYLARALRERDDVHLNVILLNHGALEERLRDAGVNVEVLNEKELGVTRLLARMRERLDTLRPHVVHSHRYKENLLAALAARATGCLSIRSIHSATRPACSLRARAVHLADAVTARLQKAAVCVSRELVTEAHREFPSLSLDVIENGIDIAELRAAAGAPVDETLLGAGTRVGFIGRMVAVKRPDIFVASAHHLVHEAPGRFSFHLFGDGPLAPVCREFVARHDLQAHVRLLGFQANLPAWLARLDVLVICSDHEGLPMVLLEAMALGIPVIAHAVGGMPHVLGMGQYGTLVHDHTPDGYADALCHFATHPADTASRAQEGTRHVEARHATAVIAARYVALYRHLLAAPAGSGGVVCD